MNRSTARGRSPTHTRTVVTGDGELVAMAEAITLLKTTRPTFYRWLRAGRLKGMKVGRQWRFYRSEIDRFLKGQEPTIDLPTDIAPLCSSLRARAHAMGLPAHEASDTVATAVTLMIRLAYRMRASDLHMATHLTQEGGAPAGVVRVRIDGVLQVLAEFDARLAPAIIEHWKRMAACNPAERMRPQDGRILIDADESARSLDLRVNFSPITLGESLTVRLLDRSGGALRLERIDYAPADRERLLKALAAPSGLVVVTGPTGSGKTTVLYACLNHVTRPERKVVSIEDPVEVFLPWVIQTGVRPAAGVTFATMLRATLRSDPDVIMIGEIRDRETLEVAIQCALTGHLVLTTLHTEDAASALTRMVEIGTEPFLVGDAVRLVLAQRLVRVLCPACSQPATLSATQQDRAAQLAREGGLDWDSLPRAFRDPAGCAKCSQTGYRHRTAIAETLEVSGDVAAALKHGDAPACIRALAVRQGMTTVAGDGIRRAAEGQTSLAEVLRVLGMK